jgi:hypothetical protein
MPLHLTKIAYGCSSLAVLEARLAARGTEARLTTRYRPKRADEIDGGSLYWIIAHRIVARSPILRFDEAEGGRTDIVIAAQAIPVMARPRRAHQGWRYLDGADAPPDLADAGEGAAAMPAELRDELSALGLV